MKNVLILSLSLLSAPFAAVAAESEACVPICETYRECAGPALHAQLTGVFGALCSHFQSCQNVVLECQAAAGACERECEPTEWG